MWISGVFVFIFVAVVDDSDTFLGKRFYCVGFLLCYRAFYIQWAIIVGFLLYTVGIIILSILHSIWHSWRLIGHSAFWFSIGHS
jgi:hypothetical protein